MLQVFRRGLLSAAVIILQKIPQSNAFEVPVMVVAGNFSLGGRSSNLAQYDPKLKLWVDQFEPHLFVYGAASGLISGIATNRSGPFDELFVVGVSASLA